MKTHLAFATLASLVLAASTLNSNAQCPASNKPSCDNETGDKCEKGERGGKGHPGRGLKKLNLTDEQQKKADAILNDARTQLKAIHEDSTLTKEQKGEKIKAIHENSKSQIDALLTPEQLQKRDELKAQRGEGKGKHKKEHKKDGDCATPATN